MKRYTTVLIAMSIMVLAQLGLAQVTLPQTISYQGVLTDDAIPPNPLDGTFVLRFKLYDVETLGTPLGTPEWSEDLSAIVTQGVFSVVLGEITAFSSVGVYFTDLYWLDIAIVEDGGATVRTLTPRLKLTAVPYAIKSRGVSGSANIFRGSGWVGIGTTTPEANLQVLGNWRLGPSASGTPPTGADNWLNANNGILYEGGGTDWTHHFSAYGVGDIARFGISAGAGLAPDTRVVITNSGSVGIGTATPSQKLDVDGTVLANGFALNNLNTKISSLITDNIDLITNNAARVRVDPSGNVGIGTLAPSAKLDVVGNSEINGNLTVTGTTAIPATMRYYSIPTVAFEPPPGANKLFITDFTPAGGTDMNLTAPVHLPHGAVIKELTAYIYDASATEDIVVELKASYQHDETPTVVHKLIESITAGNYILSEPNVDKTVNNLDYNYWIEVVWKSPLSYPTDIKFRNVLIGYTVTSPLP